MAYSVELIKMGLVRCPHNKFRYSYLIWTAMHEDFWKRFSERVCPNKKCKRFGIFQDIVHHFDKDEGFYCSDCGEFKEPPIIKSGKCVICERGAISCTSEKAHNHFDVRHKTKNWEKWEEYKSEYFKLKEVA